MSGELEVAAGVADFRLIDPPRVSPKPVSPEPSDLAARSPWSWRWRPVAFTAFAASQLRPVFHNAKELRAKFGLPLLGMVSLVTSASDVRRERVDLLRFVLASGSLIGVLWRP